MSVTQWFVIALNVCAFIAMVTAFVVATPDDVKPERNLSVSGEELPPPDYRDHYPLWDSLDWIEQHKRLM